MKSPLRPSRVLLVPVALAITASLPAQSNVTPPALGLLRLKTATRANDAAPLAAGKFAVDDLSASGVAGAAKSKRNSVDYLALDAGKEWSRPLRGNGRDVAFVSFQVYASQTTIIDLAGARLGVVTSPVTGSLQLMYDDSASGTLQWKSLNFRVGTGKYDGRNLAALPTLTVRLDPEAGVWDLYSGARLLADHLPLIEAKNGDRRFVLRSGSEGRGSPASCSPTKIPSTRTRMRTASTTALKYRGGASSSRPRRPRSSGRRWRSSGARRSARSRPRLSSSSAR